MVVTTLRINQALPGDTEIAMMIADPVKWLNDYKVGATFRYPWSSANSSNWAYDVTYPSWSTQVWTMGDGTSDQFASIKNHTKPADQNYSPLNMISMVSNDIQTVSIPGLT